MEIQIIDSGLVLTDENEAVFVPEEYVEKILNKLSEKVFKVGYLAFSKHGNMIKVTDGTETVRVSVDKLTESLNASYMSNWAE